MESGRKSFVAMSAKFECRKFSPNMFNKSKCQHCFAAKDSHSAEALENNRASRKVSKCGYLFVAPDWDFSNQIYRTKRWQRRWFVLYDDGELTYAVDEHPDTVPQGAVDMGKVLEVSDAEEVTGNKFSVAITAPDKVHFVKGTCKEESKWWFDVLSMFPRFVKGRQRRNATFPGIKGASAHTQLVTPTSGQRDTVIRSRFLSCRTDTFEEDPVIISAVTGSDKNGTSTAIPEPMSSPPLPRLVPATAASGRELGVAVSVGSSYEPRDVIIQQKSPPSDCALTLILAENGLGAGSRRTPRRVQRRRSPEEPPPERSKSAGPLSPVESQQPVSSNDHDKNEANHNNNRYAAPLYLRISDVPKVKRYDSLEMIHRDQDGPLSPKGRTTSESQGVSSLEKDDVDGPKVVSWTEKTPQRPFEGGVSEGTFKEHTVRGDPDGCGLDHAVKYNIPEIRVDNSPDETLFIKKGWLMRKEESKDWLKHWFVLCGPTLVQHADPAAEMANQAQQTINMSLVMQVRETEVARNYGIEVTLCDGTTHLLSALTAGLRAGWVQALRNAALQRNGNMTTVVPSLSIGDKMERVAENAAVRRTVLGSDQKSATVAVEESASSRALPSSPPLNRTAISRVKERARHKGVPRPADKASREPAATEDTPGGSSSVVSGRSPGALRGRNPSRRHTLPARTGPSLEPGVDANMWTASELLSNLDAGSNNAELLRKWTRAIENRHGITTDSSSPRKSSLEVSVDVGNGKSKVGGAMDNVVEGGTRKAKMLTLKNVSDLTDGGQVEPSSREEWAGRCDELKRKLEAAIREIRELKAELKKSHDNTDDLELRCFRLERTGSESEKRHRDEVALLSVRVQDLASKLANAERQLRHLVISPTNRRPRSLKGREAVSVSRELEMKMEDLESRLLSVEGSIPGGQGERSKVEDYEDKGTTVRLSRSSSFTSVTESLAMHSKLRDMDARLGRATKKIQSNQMVLARRPSLSATLSRLRNVTVAGNLGVEEGFVREIGLVGEFVVRGREGHDDVEEVERLCSSLERSLSGLRGKDSSASASSPPPSPLSAFWDIEGEKEELADEDMTAAINRLSQLAGKLMERAEEFIVANVGGVAKQEAVKVLDYLHRSSQMTRAEVGAARLLLDCSVDAERPDEEKQPMHFVACKAEERLKALREEMQRLSPVPSTEVSSSISSGVSVDRLAGVIIGKALLAAQMRMLARSSEDIVDSGRHQGVIDEAKAMVTEMKPSQRSVLASLLTVGLEGPWKSSSSSSASTPCQRCEVLAERFAEITRRHEDELKKLRKEEKEVAKVTVVDTLKEEEQRAVVSRLEDEVANLRDQLRSMVEDYEQHVTALKETFEQELSRRSEVRVGAVSVHQKYQTEMEQLKSLCEKGMAAIDHSHRRILMGLEEKHRREMEHVRAEKEQALAEETQATLAALDAMRKAHETELQREVAKFKEEYLSKMHASSDLEALRRDHEEEMESIKREILFLSRKYSLKCLDSASLEEQVELQGRQIREANELIFDVTARNKQLRVHLKQNIRELQNLTKNMENSGHKQSIQELQLQLQLKENQLMEKAEQMADLERQLVEAKNHHRALEQQCQALDVSLRANGRALGDEVNGLKARLEQVILASLATAEGWSSQSPQEKDRTQRTSFSLAEPKSKRSPVAPGTRIREAVPQQPSSPPVNAKRELTGTDKSSTVRLAGVVASRKRLFEDTDVQRS